MRGTSGPMRVSPASPGHPVAGAFIEAAVQAGHLASRDLNGRDQVGAGWVDLNVVDGARQSAADGYLATLPVNPPPLPTPDNGFGIGVAVTAPRSRGTVQLRSPEPWVAALIDPRFLADPLDLAVLERGLEAAREIAAAPALAAWDATEVFPAGMAAGQAGRRAFLRAAVTSYFHPVGTCRLGSDPASVVDLDLRVRGIDGLRVADASVMPSVPTANTNATVLAIAERAAEMIAAR